MRSIDIVACYNIIVIKLILKSIKKLNKCKDDSKLSSHLVHTTIPTLGLFCKFYHQPYIHLIFLQLFYFLLVYMLLE